MSGLAASQNVGPPVSRPPLIDRSERKVRTFIAAFAVLIVLTGTLIILLGDENLSVAFAPALIASLLFGIWKAPLRFTLFALMFCGLTLENPYLGLAFGQYASPLAPVGALLLGNLNLTTGVEALHFTGLDCITAYLFFVAIYRQVTGSRIDRPFQVGTAQPMTFFAWTAFLSIAAVWAYGVLRGGSFSDSLWQAQKLAYLPVMFLLFQVGLRGPRDHDSFVRILVAAALVRSIAAILIRAYFHPENGQELQVATAHADSLLFACAFAVLVAGFLEQPNRRRFLVCLLILPVLAWGMVANTRRLVWVELAGVLIAFYLITPRTRLKQSLNRSLAAALPLLLAYAAVGWNSRNKLFAPVQVIRSITQPETDASSDWREHENFNLIYNVADHPLVGSGFGHEYVEYWALADISGVYRQYKYSPHNSVLGLWNEAGLLGFSAYWAMLVVAVFLAARSYHRAQLPRDRIAALSAIGIMVVYIAQAYGDVGFSEWNAVFTLAPTLAIVGKLALVTGAWPRKLRDSRPESTPTLERAGGGRPQDGPIASNPLLN